MKEEAGVLGAGFYSHTTRDDTGIHEVVYNPALGHFNVSGQKRAMPSGKGSRWCGYASNGENRIGPTNRTRWNALRCAEG
jgi:hypothetical protein